LPEPVSINCHQCATFTTAAYKSNHFLFSDISEQKSNRSDHRKQNQKP